MGFYLDLNSNWLRFLSLILVLENSVKEMTMKEDRYTTLLNSSSISLFITARGWILMQSVMHMTSLKEKRFVLIFCLFDGWMLWNLGLSLVHNQKRCLGYNAVLDYGCAVSYRIISRVLLFRSVDRIGLFWKSDWWQHMREAKCIFWVLIISKRKR